MNVEIVAIGTELLLGQITDTNSAEIAKALTAIGMDCHYQTRVGDNLDRMVNALSLALSRSDMVITCGGLGPTQDDITRDAIARVMNVPLHRDPQLLARVASVFENRKRPFLPINEVQADLPEGAIPMTALPGTAPGLICPIKNTHQVIYAVPGVPSEMREMLFVDILPDIKKRKPNQELILSHTFYCLGIGESKIAELLTPRFNALASLGNPTLAYLASDTIGVRVRLTAKAATKQEAQTLLQREADIIRPMLLSHCYIETEDDETTWSPE
ncbi:MAG: hypothetical protein LBG61_06990, partial [Burkholderiales bacterium]|nr:hypothetical protein [Burkholderiales bacterium]